MTNTSDPNQNESDSSAEMERRAYEKGQGLYAILYIGFFIAAIVIPLFSKSALIGLPDDVGASRVFNEFSVMGESTNQALFFLWICMLSNFRFLLGGLFASRDSSFKGALRKHDADKYEINLTVAYTIIKILMIISIFRTYLLFTFDQGEIGRIFLIMEVLLIWCFDARFLKVLIEEDSESSSNKWIIGIDIIYGIIILHISLFLPIINWHFGYTFNGTTIKLATGACISLITLEIFICYKESIKRATADTWDALKTTFNFRRRI